MSEYDNIHYRVKARHGKPSVCDFCRRADRGMYHWAHKHETSFEPDRDNWFRLCVKCHAEYDDRRSSVAKANSERVWTEEMRNNMRQVKTGEGNGFFGLTHSDETKLRLAKTQRTLRVECECGLSTNPGNLARHIQRSGHQRKEGR